MTSTKIKTRIATPALLFGVLFWGVSFPAVKQAVATTDAYSFLSVRFTISTLILCPLFYKNLRRVNRRTLLAGFGIGLVLAASFICQTIGLQYTTAANSAFITGLYVVFVPVSIIILDRKLPEKMQILSIFLAIAGILLITLNPGMKINPGDVWSLLCALGFGIHIIMIARLIKNTDPSSFAVIQLATVAIVSTAAALATNGKINLPPTRATWGDLLFCAIFASAYMYPIQAQFQRYMTEIKAMIIYSFEPVFGALAGVVILHEILTPRLLAGGACVLVAMALSDLKTKKTSRPSAAANSNADAPPPS